MALFAHQWGHETPYDINQSVDALIDETDPIEAAGIDLTDTEEEGGHEFLTPTEASAFALELAQRAGH